MDRVKGSDAAASALLMEGRKRAPQILGNVLVLGLGVSGKATVDYLTPLIGSRVQSVTVLGGPANDASLAWADGAQDRARALGVPADKLLFVFGDEDASAHIPRGADRFDLCVASPGIPIFSELYENGAAASARTISEVELAWSESAADSLWVAITGTNGKTTTTALVARILADGGLDAKAVGNIGDACITEVARDLVRAGESGTQGRVCYVAEMSSFQLASIEAFAPDVAVMLGIKPDHVEWHRTYEHYVASKMRLIDNMEAAKCGVAILDATNDEVRARVRHLRRASEEGEGLAYIPLGTASGIRGDMRQACGAANAAFVNADDRLEIAYDGVDHGLCMVRDMRIKGPHNWLNSLAAASVAIVLDIPDERIAESLEAFEALPHRIEPVGDVGNLGFYNDSKATNVDSSVCALGAFPGERIIVLLGGHDKMTPLDELVDACRENAAVVICYGEARERFMEAMAPLSNDGIEVIVADGMVQAFEKAVANGDSVAEHSVILLSPACSSYDEFNRFEERGELFRSLAAALAEERQSGAREGTVA